MLFYSIIVRRSGDSRGFAFVRYKYADEAQKAVEKLDGSWASLGISYLDTYIGAFLFLFIVNYLSCCL